MQSRINFGLPWWLGGKESPPSARHVSSILGLGRSPGEGNGNTLQYSCLGNSMDCGAWQTIDLGVAKKSDITWQLNNNNKGTTSTYVS